MMTALASSIRRITRDNCGVAATEFALAMPFLLGVGLMGLETANRAMVQMQVSQLAVQIADNASRIGEQGVLQDRKIYEDDINDLFYGAHLQSSANLDIFSHGRVILSSLESDSSVQSIGWQRCVGAKNYSSTYGDEGDSGMNGMGPAGYEVTAFDDDAVMFVEVAYDYQPLVGEPFSFGTHEITAIASFTVRNDRDLTGIHQRDPSNPDPVADCATFGQSVYAN